MNISERLKHSSYRVSSQGLAISPCLICIPEATVSWNPLPRNRVSLSHGWRTSSGSDLFSPWWCSSPQLVWSCKFRHPMPFSRDPFDNLFGPNRSVITTFGGSASCWFRQWLTISSCALPAWFRCSYLFEQSADWPCPRSTSPGRSFIFLRLVWKFQYSCTYFGHCPFLCQFGQFSSSD